MRVAELREKRLASRIGRVLGKGKKVKEEIIGRLLSPNFQAMPACPKDMAETRKSRKKKKK